MKLRIGQTVIAIERGDITDAQVDAVVNAANSTLAMGAGVAGALKRKGGVIIEEEAMSQGPVEVGEAVMTTGGQPHLHPRHPRGRHGPRSQDGSRHHRPRAPRRSSPSPTSSASRRSPCRRWAPGSATCRPPTPRRPCWARVAEHLKAGKSTLKRVVFVLYLDDAYKAFTATLKRLGGA